ncbi:MAG: DNA methyltransferase [Methylobacterium sp.]|nr:MAG: DNA methyltransferase [Methylobacterium sp.]
MSIISNFISAVQAVHKTGIAREHAYRPALHDLLKALADDLTPVNDAAKTEVGAPDFIVLRGEIAIGHLEAKDIDLDIRAMKDANKRQQDRYRAGLPNLIYTNCLDWDFYRDGNLIASVTIADFLMGIQPIPGQFARLENLLRDFVAQRPQTITSPKDLAQRMAGKAVLIKDVLFNTLKLDHEFQSELAGQFKAFKEHLIHDITPEDFADIYAETIAYGMFAARLHDTSLGTFTRQEALELLPKSNPFLRNLFGFIAGPNLDDRIAWVIDDLAKIFQAANVKKIMAGFGKLTGQQDPFLHFYETFLAAYNPAKRKARGVWYTPEPVVNFIVRAVDEVLQTEFGLTEGLADTSKVTVDWDTGTTDSKSKPIISKKEVHRVQILDPATGTGTFLAEVIKQIAPKVKGVAEGMWSSYIEKDLIPRLHGFELLMASYAMCHMKLDMILTELGYKPTGNPPRLGVYLTNSLEEGERDVRDLFMAQWLTREAREANSIKRQTPIMCVIGNPPYSVSSSNKGDHAQELVAPYKADLDETSMNSLSDDYVKFIALAETFVAANKNGIFAMITNNSFLDGVVHRKMRKHLRETFDKIYIVNLHGDSNKRERTPDGIPDKNVFDIMQGVSIIVAFKISESKNLADVKVADVWGARQLKYEYLFKNSLKSVKFFDANFLGDYHFFTCRKFVERPLYENGFKLDVFFVSGLSGIKFRKDSLLITGNYNRSDAVQMVNDVTSLEAEVLFRKYRFSETKDWKLAEQRENFAYPKDIDFVRVAYRPLDWRWTYYPYARINRIIPRGDSRRGLMRHMIDGSNLALISGRQNKSGLLTHFFVTDCPSEMKTGESTIQSYHFPLYLYPSEQDLDKTRRVNFDPKLYKRLQTLATHPTHGTPHEVAVFDYIYGVLHCPAYRRTYAEFLKIDFPRIPWPASPDEFWDISAKGTLLRKLHLMEPAAIGPTPYPFKGEGNTVVEKPEFRDGRVWINKAQYFDEAPPVSWEFYIGGYQPAQKWLKDRKGRQLSFEDAKHYQRILKILSETDRIMKTISMTLAS